MAKAKTQVCRVDFGVRPNKFLKRPRTDVMPSGAEICPQTAETRQSADIFNGFG